MSTSPRKAIAGDRFKTATVRLKPDATIGFETAMVRLKPDTTIGFETGSTDFHRLR